VSKFDALQDVHSSRKAGSSRTIAMLSGHSPLFRARDCARFQVGIGLDLGFRVKNAPPLFGGEKFRLIIVKRRSRIARLRIGQEGPRARSLRRILQRHREAAAAIDRIAVFRQEAASLYSFVGGTRFERRAVGSVVAERAN
jgi:hypothetical protein